MTITDVEQALIKARELQEYWKNEGWQSLQLDEETMSEEILDIYPLVEIDVSATITIKLPNKIYSVPLEDVSSINVNDCLVIDISDLYPDWEERINSRLNNCFYEKRFTKDGESWYEYKYLGLDDKIRVIKSKTTWERLSYERVKRR